MIRLSSCCAWTKRKPQLVEEVVDETLFLLDQVALGLLLQHRQELDDARGGVEIGSAPCAGRRIREIAEMHGRRRREREHEAGEREVGCVRIVHCRMLA